MMVILIFAKVAIIFQLNRLLLQLNFDSIDYQINVMTAENSDYQKI